MKFQPSDSFKMVYKFDRNDDSGTPEGTAIQAWNKNLTRSAVTDGILAAIQSSQNLYLAPDGKRPDIVTNGWVLPRQQRVQGHSLTATWQATDNITVKNIAAYRKATVFAPSAIDGVSNLQVTPAVARAYGTLFAVSTPSALGGFAENPLAFFSLPVANQNAISDAFGASTLGKRLLIVASQASSIAKQYSDEIIVNYSSEKLQATLGGIWFHSNDESGGPIGIQNTFAFRFGLGTLIPQTGILPIGNEGRSFNKATSLAAYLQLEYKITPELEIVGGARITHDKKTSLFRWDNNGSPRPLVPGSFSKTKPNFLIGLNYKPNDDILLYGKYSTSFVSGGQVAGIAYDPETASSFEVGLKADLLDRKLRANLALFHVDYNHFQSPQGTSNGPSGQLAISLLTPQFGLAEATALASALSTFVVDQGKIRAKGFELELTAAPTQGLTMGTGIGYTDVSYPFVSPVVLSANLGRLDVTARPKWTVSLFGAYETQPLWNEATLQFRMDGQYRSAIKYFANPVQTLYPDGSNSAIINGTKGFMLVNGRVALRHLKIGGADAELAFWGKNITNRKDSIFALDASYSTSLNYVAPRTFGVDLNVDF